jgi:hypothetical protein
MNAGAVAVDKAELIKWYDVLDTLTGNTRRRDVEKGVQMARGCRHQDAQWLASLFPPGAEATQQRMREVMLVQRGDPRALWLAWAFGGRLLVDERLLRRAAEGGYARAQADLAHRTDDEDENMRLLELAAGKNDRDALFSLGWYWVRTEGRESAKATELFWRAAELGHGLAQWKYAEMAFNSDDWQRYYWRGRAASQGIYAPELGAAALGFLPSFEQGRNGRILHTIAPVLAPLLRDNIDNIGSCTRIIFGMYCVAETVTKLQRVIELHAAMVWRARRAIDCWSMAGRRLRVVKDMRVMIAKMAWAEVWLWSDQVNVGREERRQRRETKKPKRRT